MNRIVAILAATVVIGVAAVFLLRRDTATDSSRDDAELAVEGQFLSDSLGVGLLLPASPGWSFERPALVRGGPYMAAVHETGDASVRLFVHRKSEVPTLDDVVQRRRDALAASFRVKDIDNVIERVLLEGRQEFDGYPAWQWQALTEPVDLAGEEPARVMYFVQIVERQHHIFDALGVVKVPLSPTPEEHAANTALQDDVGFILQSAQAR